MDVNFEEWIQLEIYVYFWPFKSMTLATFFKLYLKGKRQIWESKLPDL